MTQTFKCTNCGGPLEYAETGELTVRCPFCSNTVIVPEELRQEKKPVENQPTASAPSQKPAETSTGLATLLGQLMSNRRAAREERRAIRRQWRIGRRG